MDQDGAKMGQDEAKMAQDGAKMGQDGAKMALCVCVGRRPLYVGRRQH